MNIFEKASREQLRFDTVRGALTTEQLWALPLTSARGASLDEVARGVHAELKDLAEVSFVDTKPDPRRATLELAMEIAKHVIAARQAENKAALDAKAKAERKQALMEALEKKGQQQIEALTEEQIKEQLSALEG